MTAVERKAGIGLSSIFALRMLGLFLLLPVFAVHAQEIPGENAQLLAGLALGAYGFTQALFQLPYGTLSDRFGRKPVIAFGLTLFALGCIIAALSDTLYGIILGRALQGAGAVSAAVTALAADLTRDAQRTKIMAMIGVSISLVFAVSMVGAPVLYAAIGLSGLFWFTAILAVSAIVVLFRYVPDAPPLPRVRGGRLMEVLRNGPVMRLNIGIFFLHLIQMAMWVLIPSMLKQQGLDIGAHWKIYLPAVLASFVVMIPLIILAEKRGLMKQVFSASILILAAVQVGFFAYGKSLTALTLWLALFFVAFNVLEALLPSSISRVASGHTKGTALGIYNTLQSVGLFLGGLLGGALAQRYGGGTVFLACALLALIWFGLTATMRLSSFQSSTGQLTDPVENIN